MGIGIYVRLDQQTERKQAGNENTRNHDDQKDIHFMRKLRPTEPLTHKK